MAATITTTPIGFLSHDGKSQIKGLIWQQENMVRARGAKPRGIVQIVHGMVEYVGRYDEFARYLAQRGFVVCGVDHIGHGKSVSGPDELGCLPVDGKEILIEDVHELRRTIAARYSQQTPYFLFGHSMGSFIVRAYLARYGEGLTGAIVCGTGQQPLIMSKLGNFLARRIAAMKGVDYRSALLDGMGAGSFSKGIKDARTPLDWISVDNAVVDAYLADELCGAMFSAGGYATLTDLTGEVVSLASARRVPVDLPLLYVAGAEDPVGDCGSGVRKAADLMKRAGVKQVDLVLYEGMRHEILNEPDRQRVFAETAAWMEDKICPAATS